MVLPLGERSRLKNEIKRDGGTTEKRESKKVYERIKGRSNTKKETERLCNISVFKREGLHRVSRKLQKVHTNNEYFFLFVYHSVSKVESETGGTKIYI